MAIFGEVSPLIAKNYAIRERINCFTIYLDNIPFPKKKKITRDALILSNLQPIERDFSFLIDEKTEYGAVKKTIISLKNPLIDKIYLARYILSIRGFFKEIIVFFTAPYSVFSSIRKEKSLSIGCKLLKIRASLVIFFFFGKGILSR